MKSIQTAVDRINQTLFKLPKLADAIYRADSVISRMDAEWKEGDHPRDKDGKFTSGGKSDKDLAAAGKDYQEKGGGKKSVAGLMQYLIKQGGFSAAQIQQEAVGMFNHPEDKADWVQWYYKDLLKKGENIPQMPTGDGHVFSPESHNTVKEYMTETKSPSASGLIKHMIMAGGLHGQDIWRQAKLLFGGKIDVSYVHYYFNELSKEKGYKNIPPLDWTSNKKPPKTPAKDLSSELYAEISSLKKKWENVLPANKPKLEKKQKELTAVLDYLIFNNPTDFEAQQNAIKKIEPIEYPNGLAQKSMNEFIAKLKAEFKVGPIPTASLPAGPSKPLQDEIYQKAVNAPPLYRETVTKSEGKGSKFKARMVTDTEQIPGDWYAKVTAAYGNSDDAMTKAVDEAMEQYHLLVIKKAYTKDEKVAMENYQGGNYSKINLYLAGKYKEGFDSKAGYNVTKHGVAEIKKYAEDLVSAYNRPESVVPADTPVWRGMTRSLEDVTSFTDPQEIVGRSFVYDSFTSVSRSQAMAEKFGTDTMMKFTIPAGTKGIVMRGQRDYEREIVLGPNTVYRVTKVEQKAIPKTLPSGDVSSFARYILHCEYLGEKVAE